MTIGMCLDYIDECIEIIKSDGNKTRRAIQADIEALKGR